MIVADLWQDAPARADFLNVVARLHEAVEHAAPGSSVWVYMSRTDFAEFERWAFRHPSLLGTVGGTHVQLRAIPYPVVVTLPWDVAGRRE